MLTNAGMATPFPLHLRLHSKGAHAAGVKGLGSRVLGCGAKPVIECLAAGKTLLSLATVLAGNPVFRSRGHPANPTGKSAHSGFWFLAPWVQLMQSIREWAFCMCCQNRATGERPLTRQVTATVTALRLRLHSVTARASRRYTQLNDIREPSFALQVPAI